MENEEFNDADEEEFGFSRNYFLAKEVGTSGKKSTHKLSEIDVVPEEELREELSKLEPKHDKEIKALVDSHRSLYPEWLFQLRCGFGLLMYGFGSKKVLLEDFASKALLDYTVFVINGYLQSINVKHALTALVDLLQEELKASRKPAGSSSCTKQPSSSKSMDDLLAFLNGSHDDEPDCLICVVVHNIDGPALRDSDSQQHLARIAACSHIRMVASIDHINAPLLWDKRMVHTQFNWWWHHVPTFAPYKVEGTFFPLILAHGGSAQSAKTAAIVLQSLTPNAQSVFKVLAERQLSHPDEDGMPISDLYATCRERFLVSSQMTLNSHLTEFKDHDLVKTRRNADGQECLHVPLSSDAIQKLLQDISQ